MNLADGLIDDPAPLIEQTLPALLQRQARLGSRVLLRHGDCDISYEEAPAFAALWAGRLAAAGVGFGDRVAVIAENSIELMGLWLGAASLGAVFAPINTAARGLVLKGMLENANPTVLAVDPALEERIDACEASMPALKARWRMDRLVSLPGITPSQTKPVGPGDPLIILYTSGTTGPSKGVVCPHAMFYWWGILNRRALGIGPGDVIFTVLPQFHTNALNSFWQALVSGATYAFGKRFSVSQFWTELATTQATVTHLLGAMTAMLLSRPPDAKDTAHRVRVALSGATKAEAAAAFQARFGIRLVDGYGSTEANFAFSTTNGTAPAGSMGRPFPEFDVRVVDDLDQPVAAGVAGELVVRPKVPFIMASGYFQNDAATVQSWRNLWFHTGDRIVCDDDGVYRFLDRTKDAIRRRGENISSFEVERALLEHPAIVKAGVVGVPATVGDEDVLAWIELAPGATIDCTALIRFLEPQLPYFAVPRYIAITDALPLTESGKVRKFALRERGLPDDAWDREAHGVQVLR
jgi:carnitine-CoA ligase